MITFALNYVFFLCLNLVLSVMHKVLILSSLLVHQVALERYNKMKGNAPERLVSGSDDFTMFLWEPAVSKHPKTRMTGHQQVCVYSGMQLSLWFSSCDKNAKHNLGLDYWVVLVEVQIA